MKRVLFVLPAVISSLFFAASPVAAQSAYRGGFTFMVDLGVGVQNDRTLDETGTGVSGINIGLGGWVNDKIAVIARASGTVVSYNFGNFGDLNQVAGVVAPTIQMWPTKRSFIEAGAGIALKATSEDTDERGFGVLLGAGASVLNRGKHNLIVSVEYAPLFAGGTVHNFSINFGYQYW